MGPADPANYNVAIIGAGPAGLSAAARAAEIDRRLGHASPTYIVLEASPRLAKTIQRYQKGKHVMAEPGYLDLRSDLRFKAGSREQILDSWSDDAGRLGMNIRYAAEVTKVAGQRGQFVLQLIDGQSVQAANIVLAIGLEGNARKMGVPGEQYEEVQYQLDDPKAYRDETIVVVGAGDAAIENALALCEQNDVWILNRGKEFSRAKDANLSGILAAISDRRRRLSCYYETRPKSIERAAAPGSPPLALTLNTPSGEKTIACHRIIARLGADPPRAFVESIGVQFPGPRREAVPVLSRTYESNVPGVYIVGSLAGYPLIKQALNQGFDVAEYVYGNNIRPADFPLLELQLCGLPFERAPDELLDRIKSLVPMFRELNALAFRELIIESEIVAAYPDGPEFLEASQRVDAARRGIAAGAASPRSTRVIREGDVIYEPGEFGTSFFSIAYGKVTLQTLDPPGTTQLKLGDFFGEMSLLSGRPRGERAIAGPGCILVETPRRTMIKLMNSNEAVRTGIDWIFVVRELQHHFAPQASLRDLREIVAQVAVRRFNAGQLIFTEGDPGDSLFVVRSGNVSLSRRRHERDIMVAQLPAGHLLGEMSLMGDAQRRETARATVASELIEVQRSEFLRLSQRPGAPLDVLQRDASERVTDNARMEVQPEGSQLMNFLISEGLGEATNVLVIDESLCVGCDNCETACAETHGGISRLNRKAGASFAQIHIPVACRHCEQPHCMKDCPPNAIKRSAGGEVFIDDTCIGCGNCQVNCPYGVIRMSYDAPQKPGLISWLLFGAGPGVGEQPHFHPSDVAKSKGQKATKCDACKGVSNGPACVKSCPTGAAKRITPAQYLDLVDERRR
jgi:Fe-S-cluster-containing hydrogenase component 2/thioredoxin reductase/CRP-like cAMP-binding protein